MYGCFERSRDALFNVCDALLSEPQACSLPELSLSPFFERRWPSVYEALQDGRIDIERLRRVFVQALLEDKAADEPVWIGLVRLSMERLEAESSRDRGIIYVPNLPHATTPVSVGWQFSTLMLLPDQPSSWVGIEQLRAVLPLIQRTVIVLADRWMRGSTLCADLPRTELRGTDPYPPQPHIVPCSSPAHGQTRRALQTWAVVSRHPARDAFH